MATEAAFHVTQNWDGTENLYLDGGVVLERATPQEVKKKRDILLTAFLIKGLETEKTVDSEPES